MKHDVEDFAVRDLHALAGQAAYVADAFVYVVGYEAVVAADADVVESQHDGAVCRRYGRDDLHGELERLPLAAPHAHRPQ